MNISHFLFFEHNTTTINYASHLDLVNFFYQLFSSFPIDHCCPYFQILYTSNISKKRNVHCDLFLNSFRNTIKLPRRIARDLLNLTIKAVLTHYCTFYEWKQNSSGWKHHEIILMKFLRNWTDFVVTKGFFYY